MEQECDVREEPEFMTREEEIGYDSIDEDKPLNDEDCE